MPDGSSLQPGQRFANGRFVLVRPLGRGGMGEVWLAQDERLQEEVALKFLPAEIRGNAAALDDLRRETARSHKLTHPHIVRIHDLHEEADGVAFIIMEYVDGPTLEAVRLAQPSRVLPWDYLRPLVAQLCAALDYAHGERVVHRDLKPANLMVDSRGRLKLADFGIAAVVLDSSSRVSVKNVASGTLAFMSPQQLAGKRPQMSDDIYALGATLYDLLTSKPPFYTGDLTHQVLREPPEPLAERLAGFEIQNDIPPDVAALIMACLAKEPPQRPQSARAVAEWIGLEVEKKPSVESLAQAMFPSVEAGPSSPPVQEKVPPAAFGKRRSMTALLIFGVLIALAVTTFVWYSKKGNHPAKIEATPANPAAAAAPAVNPAPIAAAPEPAAAASAAVPSGWTPLFDGQTLSGWTALGDSDWRAEPDGVIATAGPASHLISPEIYANFEFKADVKLAPEGDGGLGFRAEKMAGVPTGYTVKANLDPRHPLTGSLFKITHPNQRYKQELPVKITSQLALPDTWFTESIIAIDNRIIIKVSGQTVADYVDRNSALLLGRMVLQQWHPGVRVAYRHVMVKPLPDDPTAALSEAGQDAPDILNTPGQAKTSSRLKKILFFSKSSNYEHAVIKTRNGHPGVAQNILADLGKANNIEFTFAKNGELFTPGNIAKFDAFCFYTCGDLTVSGVDKFPPMSVEGKNALLEAIHNGKGFIGIHSASDTFHSPGSQDGASRGRWESDGDDADPYVKMIGAECIGHGTTQSGHQMCVDRNFPGMSAVPDDFGPVEEWYSLKNFAPDLHVLLVQDTSMMTKTGKDSYSYNRPNYPSTWVHMYGRGRVFYTSMGHGEDIWHNAVFQQLLASGINWAAGNVKADVTPNVNRVTPGANVLPPAP